LEETVPSHLQDIFAGEGVEPANSILIWPYFMYYRNKSVSTFLSLAYSPDSENAGSFMLISPLHMKSK
jgi:hypothetical protein